jgi:hypothetical protein
MLFASVFGVTSSQTTSGAPCPCAVGTLGTQIAANARIVTNRGLIIYPFFDSGLTVPREIDCASTELINRASRSEVNAKFKPAARSSFASRDTWE